MMLESFAGRDALGAGVRRRPRRRLPVARVRRQPPHPAGHRHGTVPGRRPANASVAQLPAGRRAVLYAVRRRGEATAEQVAEQLDITVSGARQHLTALAKRRPGRVERAAVARGPARPAHARVRRDQRGRRVLPEGVRRAHQRAARLRRRHRPRAARPAVRQAARSAASRARARAWRRSARFGAKVAELTRILDEDGYLASWEQVEPGVFRIVEHNCAIWAVAERYGQACTSELEFIRTVLAGAEVERVQHMVRGRAPLRVRGRTAR